MNYGYIRVSKDKKTVENPRYEITEFAQKTGIQIDEWIEETISGTLEPQRRQLGTLLDRVQKDDLIICSELSRFGRSLFMIMSILNKLMESGARVWTIKDGYRLGDDIQSKVLAFALGLSADIGTTIMLMQGISINRIAKLYGVHRNTVKLFIKRKKLDSEKNIQKVVNLCG